MLSRQQMVLAMYALMCVCVRARAREFKNRESIRKKVGLCTLEMHDLLLKNYYQVLTEESKAS